MAVSRNKQARRFAVMALAISAFTLPAVAQADPSEGGRGGWRGRSEEGGRQNREAPQQRQEQARAAPAPQQRQEQVRAAPAPQAAPQAQANWQARADRGSRGNWNGGNAAPQAVPVPQPAQQQGWNGGNRQDRGQAQGWNGGNRPQQTEPVRTWNGANRQQTEQARGGDRNRDQQPRNWTDAGRQDRDGDRRERDGNWNRDRNAGGYVQGGTYYGTSQGTNRDNRDWNRRDRDHDGDRDGQRWNRQWRDNSHYNWFSYRSSHPSNYRLGNYYAPYRNYSYQRLSIGFYLDSLFFSQNYWIDNPGNYRLPDVYGPYRWVRYYDDALLVDIYTGEVVDVINNFFW